MYFENFYAHINAINTHLISNFIFFFLFHEPRIKLQIWRMVDPNSTDTLHPGVVTTENLREKLSKQLKIDLDENEAMHIFREDDDNDNTDSSDSAANTTTNPINFAEIDEVKIQAMIDDFIPTTDTCPIKINRLGDYLAVIGLKGGHTVPLRFVVRQRAA